MSRGLLSLLTLCFGCVTGYAQAFEATMIDRNYGMYASFEANSSFLHDNYGIKMVMPEGFVDLTFGVSKLFTFSHQPLAKAGSLYVPVMASADGECLVLYEDYLTARHKRELVCTAPQSLMEQELRIALSHSEGERMDTDLEKIILQGEGRQLSDEDRRLFISSLPGSEHAEVRMTRVEVSGRNMNLLRKNFLQDKFQNRNYICCCCLYFMLNNGICQSVKLFLTKKGQEQEAKYIKCILDSLSYAGYRDADSFPSGPEMFELYVNEAYPDEQRDIYGLNINQIAEIVAKCSVKDR